MVSAPRLLSRRRSARVVAWGIARAHRALIRVPEERKTPTAVDANKVKAEPGGCGSPSARLRSPNELRAARPCLRRRSSHPGQGALAAAPAWGGSARQHDRGASCASIDL